MDSCTVLCTAIQYCVQLPTYRHVGVHIIYNSHTYSAKKKTVLNVLSKAYSILRVCCEAHMVLCKASICTVRQNNVYIVYTLCIHSDVCKSPDVF